LTHRYSKYIKEINLVGDIIFLNLGYSLVYFFSIGQFDTLFRSIYFELQLFFNIA
jgi:putative colanic acid biosynthesis UDP-glucose lipid carrier transferase